jgi:predicted DNA-binding ribbon-helix-helix protein
LEGLFHKNLEDLDDPAAHAGGDHSIQRSKWRVLLAFRQRNFEGFFHTHLILILLSQKVATNGEENHLFGQIHSEISNRQALIVLLATRRASVSKDAFWEGLKEIAGERHTSLSDLVAAIDSERQHGNLSSAIRLFVLDFHRVSALRGAMHAFPSALKIKRGAVR